MAVDLSDFESAKKRVAGCAVARLPISPEQRAALDAVLARPAEYSGDGILNVIHRWGCQIGKDAVLTHRRKDCACARKSS